MAIESQQVVSRTQDVLEQIRLAAVGIREYSDEQVVRLRDPKNQKALDATIQAGAVWNGTGRLMNKEVLPRAMKVLDNLAASTESLDQFLRATDRELNGGVLPGAAVTIQELATVAREVNTAAQGLTEAVTASAEDIHRVLGDPAITASLTAIQGSAEHIEVATKHLEEAAAEIPEIMESVQEIAKTSSRFRVWVLLSQIGSTIGRVFF
ncbi:MAG: hypothetical protein ABIH23_20505 [bacterium]